MANVVIRQAVTPDIEYLSRFDHSVKSNCVWQMLQTTDEEKIYTTFNEMVLPREIKLTYPQSTDSLQERWKDYSTILIASVSDIPVGYIAINTSFSQETLWIKDLVVDENWRRKGIGTTLYHAAKDWGINRKYLRVTMEISSKNYPGICLAKKLGFAFSGFHDNYFKNNDIALFFSRYLV